MNIGFDLGHPAHFHLFKNFIEYLKISGYVVYIHIREKDILKILLDNKKWEYKISISKTTDNLIIAFIKHLISYWLFCKKNKIGVHFGTSVVNGIVSRIISGKSIGFAEDDFKVSKLQFVFGYTFCHKFIKPDVLRFESFKKITFHSSYHELAYLHPNNFIPNPEVLKKYNLEKKNYIIIRFSALKAHHDIKAKGISKDLWKKIEKLLTKFKIIISIENNETHQIKPWEMHHILAFAKMIISDSQTMTIEGAILGIPSIRINTFVGKSTVIDELEKKYKLAYGFFPNDEATILKTIENLLQDKNTDTLWHKKRKKLLLDKIDMNLWMIDFFNNNFQIYRN